MTRLYIFDMDGTLIPDTTGMLEIAKIMGHTTHLQLLEKQYAEKQIDSLQFATAIYKLWSELTPAIVEQAFEASPKLNNIREALATIDELKGSSCLITTAPHFFASHFKEFGFDHIFASKPFDLIDKKFSPEDVLHAKDKPLLAEQLCQKLGFTLENAVAFGDSVSDIPLFQRLKHTVSVNGSALLNEHAKYHYKGYDLIEAVNLVSF